MFCFCIGRDFMKNGRFKHLTLISFIIVLIIVIADTAICARKDMNRKSQKAASVISSQKNGEDGKDKSGDTAETTKKDNSQSIINISGNNIRTIKPQTGCSCGSIKNETHRWKSSAVCRFGHKTLCGVLL